MIQWSTVCCRDGCRDVNIHRDEQVRNKTNKKKVTNRIDHRFGNP